MALALPVFRIAQFLNGHPRLHPLQGKQQTMHNDSRKNQYEIFFYHIFPFSYRAFVILYGTIPPYLYLEIPVSLSIIIFIRFDFSFWPSEV
jgi:hypothetical protein